MWFFRKKEGRTVDYNAHLALINQNTQLSTYVKQLEKQIAAKRRAEFLSIPIDPFDSFEDEPGTGDERKRYVAEVDDFYERILKKKIGSSVGRIRQLLASPVQEYATTDRLEYDAFVRGMEAGLWKIHDWATVIQAENRENNPNQ